MKTVRRGEIYYADLSPVVGSEQGGFRPVLIIQNNVGNHYSSTTIVAAITSKEAKAGLPTHVHTATSGLERKSVVMLEQIRTIDKSRLLEYVGKLDKKNMQQVDQALIISLGLKHNLKDEGYWR